MEPSGSQTSANQCAKCGGSLPVYSGNGRPRRFCGEACQRAAALEVKRLNARIAALEKKESEWRVKGADLWSREAAKEIGRLEIRLAGLLSSELKENDE